MNQSLIIVESASKCQKIESYLGDGFKCIACFGHLRELCDLTQIDIKNDFATTYSPIDNPIKKKQIQKIRSEIAKSREVILACDSDREGEAICWHLCDMFDLDVRTTKRILFNEITPACIRYAVQNPTTINMNLVNAQKARQIVDLLVGFKISPLLWKAVVKNKDNSLSAGRCQTPALRIIYDNQRAIDQIVPQKIYKTTGIFTNLHLSFELNKTLNNADETIDFLEKSVGFIHMYSCTAPAKVFRECPMPFTTSRIQQTVSNILHYSPKETMQICQFLYEAGHITYMRTDSQKYSGEFIQKAKKYIKLTWNNEKEAINYINANIDMLTSDKNQKEAHEAIRPTNIHLRELPEKEGTIKQQKVYKMIWENTLESCMASADFYKITANITAPFDAKYALHTEIVDFMGWKIVKEQEEKIKKNDKTYNYLLSLTQTVQHIDPQKIICKEVMAESKLHYTEARLVQLLEEKGIGRPSTFSSLVEKIQEREYVKKTNILGKIVKCLDYELENGAIHELESSREFGGEKNKLLIQPLGIIVMQFLETHFDTIFQYEYTSSMENQLDDITRGNKFLLEICRNCLSEIDSLVEKTGPTLKKKEIKIDETHTFIIGKYGPVIKCLNTGSNDKITFQPAKKDLSLETLEKGEYSLEEITAVNGDNSDVILLGKYEETDLFLKKGRYGLYASWDKKTISLKTLGNRPCENIGLEEVIQVIETTERPISENIKIKRGKKGYYIFYKTKKNKKPEFYTLDGFAEKNNILSCDINLLKKWIKEKYNIV